MILGGKVDGGVAEELELARAIPEAVQPEQLHGPVHGQARRLVLVEQVPAQEDPVDVVLPGQLQDLLEGIEGVVPADRVLLVVSQMVVRG